MGLGDVSAGDDGFGVRLAEALRLHLPHSLEVINAGVSPERYLGRLVEKEFDHLIFLDAVDFGGAPGSVALLNSDEMMARFPQVSTHRISLSVLAQYVEYVKKTKALLLGVQPESLKPGARLTPTVQKTLDGLVELICGVLESGKERQHLLATDKHGFTQSLT